ncbi:helix-turn-helix domain-containing protein [Streptomyces sp. NPDC014991]|uniref:helix-turn-helix domain-containing protein n=1 Tax=Streptomyces sp. NPDC014991 TaxID=3364935 RepID=UPI0036F69546
MSQTGGGTAKLPAEAPQPAQVSTPAEFTAALRALRTWSGLTYRQLESKATAHADALPASTIATALGRTSLPRERFVDAFTRACGLSEEESHQWLEVRNRIAADKPAPTSDDDRGDSQSSASNQSFPARAPRGRWVASLVVAGGLGIAGTLGVSSLLNTSTPSAAPPAMSVTGLRILAVGSWARIHPARTPDLCLTEGRDRSGHYKTAIAAQRPCRAATLPHVFLEPLGKNVVQIQWHHPKYSIGCLTVLPDGPGRDLIEPREDCADDNRAQQFRIEPFGPPAAVHFRIRPVITDQCLSLRDQETKNGAEIVQGRCSGAADQDFLIDLIPPPPAASGHTHE